MKTLLLSIIVLSLAGTALSRAEDENPTFYSKDCETLSQTDATTFEWVDFGGHWGRYASAEEITRVDANTIVYEGIEYRTVTHLSREEFVRLCG